VSRADIDVRAPALVSTPSAEIASESEPMSSTVIVRRDPALVSVPIWMSRPVDEIVPSRSFWPLNSVTVTMRSSSDRSCPNSWFR